MATKYSDAIRIRETKSAYNIQTEEKNEWENFIPNEQFNSILQHVINSVNNKVVDEHRSFWLEGTYGTGKSHAAAVIKHLLCDPVEDIREWLNQEYAAEKYAIIREAIFALREQIRLFPVTMYGHCSIAHKDDLSLQIQTHVRKALDAAGIHITVRTDFDNYIQNIEKNPGIWDTIISGDAELASYAPDRRKLIQELRSADSGVLTAMKNALRKSGLHVRLEQENLCKWFFEVQDELVRQQTGYKGILLIWDEFTDVMLSDIGPSLLVDLQELAEATQQTANNSYFFHIAHPSALDTLKAEERTKTQGRYRFMHYNMEPVSAFKIMSRKFVHEKNSDNLQQYLAYHNMTDKYFRKMRDVYERYANTSNDPQETLQNLKDMFPVHPSTANMATYYAREAGSSSRSVFEFLGSNPAIKTFLDDENCFRNEDMITADYLWDFVLEEFNSKVQKYGVVTERFNSYHLHVKNKGEHYLAVFKAILLLNAMNNLAFNETVTPSEENIRNMFVGTPIDDEIGDILAWINEQGVVQRSPQGIYEIRFSALDTKEIEDIKKELLANNFRFTQQVLRYGDTAQKEFMQNLKGVNRPNSFEFFSEVSNEYTLLNSIENGRKNAQPYSLYIALMMARTTAELASLKETAAKACAEERFQTTTFVVFDTLMNTQDYDRFIEYQANAQCANRHGYAEQQKSHTDNAKAIIKEWMRSIKSGTCTVFVQGSAEPCPARQLATAMNSAVATRIFSRGPESLNIIRLKAPQTCWNQQHAKSTADNVLSFSSKEDISSRCNGPAKHMALLLQDSVDDNLQFKADIDPNHPLYVVTRFVKSKIDHSDKQNIFNLADKFQELTRAPYGLFNSHAGYGMLAFALRPYIDKVFDTNGKPINAQRMLEYITDTFKIWESGSSSNIHKVDVKFETKEEGAIAKGLISLFGLNKLNEYKDVSSLTDARWALRNGYCQKIGYPLWAVKYCDKLQSYSCKEQIQKLTDNIITICREIGQKDPHMLVETTNLLTEVRYEYSTLVTDDGQNFDNGFRNFLFAEPNVQLQVEDYDAAFSYIRQHMESGYGYWTEDAVIEQLKNWKLSTIQKSTPQEQPVTPQPNVNRDDNVEHKNEKKSKARQKVDNITIDEARMILQKLCDTDDDFILDTILS